MLCDGVIGRDSEGCHRLREEEASRTAHVLSHTEGAPGTGCSLFSSGCFSLSGDDQCLLPAAYFPGGAQGTETVTHFSPRELFRGDLGILGLE